MACNSERRQWDELDPTILDGVVGGAGPDTKGTLQEKFGIKDGSAGNAIGAWFANKMGWLSDDGYYAAVDPKGYAAGKYDAKPGKPEAPPVEQPTQPEVDNSVDQHAPTEPQVDTSSHGQDQGTLGEDSGQTSLPGTETGADTQAPEYDNTYGDFDTHDGYGGAGDAVADNGYGGGEYASADFGGGES